MRREALFVLSVQILATVQSRELSLELLWRG
ncbi:hypothetical protein LINPERHAP1_LOCUS30131 [Linum perenne]